MFHFIHGYLSDTPFWKGLVAKGFIDDTSGVKLMQSALSPDEHRFNAQAYEGSELNSIVFEANRVFYVDRLQGGSFMYRYAYDKKLINLYKERLGDNFLGFQMHEWASNFLGDYKRIVNLLGKYNYQWTAEDIEKALKAEFPYSHLFLEAQFPEEWADTKLSEDADSLLHNLKRLFMRRQESVDSMLLPTDSYYYAPRMEIDLGARALMPEIGAQIPGTRVQIAFARGMARMRGVRWGTYYEPWGGNPFSTCYYKKDPDEGMVNEWYIRSKKDFPFIPNGPHGGSSRALQRRLFYYSYLSGAHFISEEWGVCNTFYDWKDFEITPYGAVKKEFLDFVSACPELGEPYTPFAIVLPKELTVYNLGAYSGLNTDYFYGNGTQEENIHNVLRSIYWSAADGKNIDLRDMEACAMTTSEFGDLFDIVYEDYPQICDRYIYAIDLTKQKITITGKNNSYECSDMDEFKHHLRRLIDETVPLTVTEDIHWSVNRLNDQWIIGMFNNEGVERSAVYGDKLRPDKTKTVKMTMKRDYSVEQIAGNASIHKDEKAVYLEIPAGSFAILILS